MYYSVSFIVGSVEKNTWDDWQMIPNTPPMIPSPEVNTVMIDIPGRPMGAVDLTDTAFDHKTFKRMTGSWTFYKEPITKNTRKEFYEEIRKFLDGNTGKVILKDEDPNHYYSGRFQVSLPSTSRGPMALSISFDLVPARWNVLGDSLDHTFGAGTITYT